MAGAAGSGGPYGGREARVSAAPAPFARILWPWRE
jgi:hypothetical protein